MIIKNKNGFSLLEILAAIVMGSIIILSLHSVFVSGNAAWQTYDGKANTQNQARKALFTIAKELREANNVVVTTTADSVTVNFTNQEGEAVTLSWSTIGNNANKIIYQDQSTTRTIASDISALSLNNSGSSVSVNLTSTKDTATGQTSSFSLKEKIALR